MISKKLIWKILFYVFLVVMTQIVIYLGHFYPLSYPLSLGILVALMYFSWNQLLPMIILSKKVYFGMELCFLLGSVMSIFFSSQEYGSTFSVWWVAYSFTYWFSYPGLEEYRKNRSLSSSFVPPQDMIINYYVLYWVMWISIIIGTIFGGETFFIDIIFVWVLILNLVFLVQDKRRQLYYLGVLVGISINSVLWWTEGFGIPYYEKWENAILVVGALLYLLISVYLFKKYIKDLLPIKKQ